MTRRVPVVPTLVVAAAVATMIALGVWQLRRAEWKADLIARYTQAQAISANVPWPGDAEGLELSNLDMAEQWSKLGFVINQGTDGAPDFVEVERSYEGR